MVVNSYDGRSNQKARTRRAIVEAARGLMRGGETVTMPDVARAALVSEATAYRYFPDLASLLSAAFVDEWPSPQEALAPVAGSDDPVERVRFMVSATIARPELAPARPGFRFGLIDQALGPFLAELAEADPHLPAQLR